MMKKQNKLKTCTRAQICNQLGTRKQRQSFRCRGIYECWAKSGNCNKLPRYIGRVIHLGT